MRLCKKKYPFEREFLKDEEAGLGLDVDKNEVDRKHSACGGCQELCFHVKQHNKHSAANTKA